MTVELTRLELSAAEVRGAAARSRDAKASRRMLALALVLEGRSRDEAARSCGWIGRRCVTGCTATTRLGWPACPIDRAVMVRGRGFRPSSRDRSRNGLRTAPTWRETAWCAGAASICRRGSCGSFPSACTSARWAGCCGSCHSAHVGAPAAPAKPARGAGAFQREFASLMTAAVPAEAAGKPVEVWFSDEARVGRQGTLTRVWARRGSRPRAPATDAIPGPGCSGRCARRGKPARR